MNPILDIAKIKEWITNDNVPDHAPTTDTNEISVPHKITPPPHPKRQPIRAVELHDKFMYNLKMANISGRNMYLCLLQ